MTKTTNISQDSLNVPNGYKNSPLGVIPKEWEIKRFKKLFSFKNGINSGKENYGQGIKFVNTLDVLSNNFMTYDSLRGSVVVTDNQKKEFAVVKGDVLFNRTSETPEDIGHASVYVDTQNAVFGGFIIRAHSLDNSIDIDFKKYCFATPSVRKQIVAFGNGAIRYNIGQEDIAKTLIALPPLPEQQKIAEILSTWDVAIEKQNAQIEQLELRKRGLMQQLLTGKLRLRNAEGKRFKGEWKKVRLGEVFKLLKGAGLSKDKLEVEGKYPCILYGELYTSYNEIIKEVNSYTNYEEGTKSKKGDILIPSSTTTNGIDLITSSCVTKDDVLIGGDVIILRPKKDVNPEFFSLLFSNALKAKFVKFTQGVTIIHIYGKDFINEKVSLPSLAEQTAIAEVLSTVDREIEIEKQKLAALQNQKKGLMQVLLSGKIRVKI
jgi:type I restriction enzyme S subunit